MLYLIHDIFLERRDIVATQYKQSICLNGHQITDEFSPNETVTGYCEQCGAKLIDSCPHCKYPIEGFYYPDGVVYLRSPNDKLPVPKYCKKCGTPYPWTKDSLDALNEVIQLSNLSIQDKESLQASTPDLLVDTPRTKVAVLKWKTIGKSILNLAHDIIVEVASESITKAIYGN